MDLTDEEWVEILDESVKYVPENKMKSWLKKIIQSKSFYNHGEDIKAALEIMKAIKNREPKMEIISIIEYQVRLNVGNQGESSTQDKKRLVFLKHLFKDLIAEHISCKKVALRYLIEYIQIIFPDEAKGSYSEREIYQTLSEL